jgi:hypothetical protein
MTRAKLFPRGVSLKDFLVRSKKLLAGGAVCATLAMGLLFPASAQAYWGPAGVGIPDGIGTQRGHGVPESQSGLRLLASEYPYTP